jgi:hypothetical protein
MVEESPAVVSLIPKVKISIEELIYRLLSSVHLKLKIYCDVPEMRNVRDALANHSKRMKLFRRQF